jgi:hypothetical protein
MTAASSGHIKAFRDARRNAFCNGIFALSAASASSSAMLEFGRVLLADLCTQD